MKFISLVTTKSISFPLSSLLFATPIKNWFSARLSLRRSACKRKGSERALVDTRGRRVRFLLLGPIWTVHSPEDWCIWFYAQECDKSLWCSYLVVQVAFWCSGIHAVHLVLKFVVRMNSLVFHNHLKWTSFPGWTWTSSRRELRWTRSSNNIPLHQWEERDEANPTCTQLPPLRPQPCHEPIPKLEGGEDRLRPALRVCQNLRALRSWKSLKWPLEDFPTCLEANPLSEDDQCISGSALNLTPTGV